MILAIIILVFVGAIAFFHYTQGFFSATLSAMITIIAAVLAFSYHETVVESFLGGRFSDAAHALSLAVLFAVIYLVLRIAFDKMVPGNVRFPVTVDKVGGGAMGLVAGLFAGGIMAIVAQYLPLMPSVAGYARYATEGTRRVTVPPEATGRRAEDSETWDPLKSEKPGEFEAADKQAMILPMDDIVVNTVNHLSDGGSLGWDRPLTQVHPAFLDELFGQRLGIQPRANRVATAAALGTVEAYRVDSLQRKDHEYKDIRQRPQETGPLKPKGNEVLVVVRMMFTRSATDKDGLVKFSPGSVRLVAPKGSGPDAQWVNYHPLGTVDKGQVLFVSALDDFLFVDSKGADRGADFAFMVDKSSVEGQGNAMKFPEGTFIEFKRMARKDLDKIKPPTAYKASENVLVVRKKQLKSQEEPTQPQATGTAAGTGAVDVEGLKAKLIGSWASTSDAGQLIIDFKADGTLTFNNTPKSGLPTVGNGSWQAVPEKSTADTLVINRTLGASTAENSLKFNSDTEITLSSPNNPPRQLQKR
jgi:hypothetical protein